MIEFNLTKTIKSIQSEERDLQEFLEILSNNYRYSLDQLLILYGQGYRGKEDLVGYEFLAKVGRDFKRCNKYICVLSSSNPVTLFGIPRLSDLSSRHFRRERRFNSYNIRRFSDLVQKVRTAEAIEVKHEPGLEGYRLEGFNLFMDMGSEDKFNDNISNIIYAAIEKRSQSYKSIFCKEIVEYLWFKKELKNYARIKQLSGKDFHDLLNAAFEEYKKLYYTYEKKYFTIDEIAILNMCCECSTIEDIFFALRSVAGVKQEFLVKIRGLNRESVERILTDVKNRRLTHYPEYKF